MMQEKSSQPFAGIDLDACLSHTDWLDIGGCYLRKSDVTGFRVFKSPQEILIFVRGGSVRLFFKGQPDEMLARLQHLFCDTEAVPMPLLGYVVDE